MISGEDRDQCHRHGALAIMVREFVQDYGITALLWAVQRGLTDTEIADRDFETPPKENKELGANLHKLRLETPDCIRFKEELMKLAP